MKVMSYGTTYEVQPYVKKYYNGNLAIRLDYFDEDLQGWLPFVNLTVNFENKLSEDQAYVDTNNCPWAEEFIEEYQLGEDTGRIKMSGYCFYPLYRFNLEKIKEYEDRV